MTGIIYYIFHIESGKGYVGQHNKINLNTRFKAHCKDNRSRPLSNAIRKYGVDRFISVRIDIAYTQDELDEKEIYWIDRLEALSPDGYNLTTGGKSGWGVSFETKEKMSSRLFSNSHRENLRKAATGVVQSDDHKLAAALGHSKMTIETIRYIRNSPQKSIKSLCEELKLTRIVVHKVRHRQSFKSVV